MKLPKLYKYFLECSGINTDTRNIRKDDFFVALKGSNFNGNLYAREALDKGAKYALVDEDIKGPNILRCNDCLKTLQELANYHRKQFNIPILALTGSNGKTTTKELIVAVLKKAYQVHFTLGNFNNHIGVPLTLLKMSKNSNLAIIEMGANHVGEIADLCAISEPSIGIITNIGKAHLEGFGGTEGVIRGKSEMYTFIKKENGLIIYNENDELLYDLVDGYQPSITYSSNDYSTLNNHNGILTLKKGSDIYESQLTGRYNLTNISCAIAVGEYFDVASSQIKEAIREYQPKNNRSQIKNIDSNTYILDAYNANPSSMRESLINLSLFEGMKKILILGEMRELGDAEQKEHQIIIEQIENTFPSAKVYLVGLAWEGCITDFEIYKNVTELKKDVPPVSLKDSTILLKGSRSTRIEEYLS